MGRMKKYVFKVYTKSSVYYAEIKGLEEADLQEIDKFTVELGGILDLKQLLAKANEIDEQEITKVVILSLRKNREYSIITNNKYLKNTLLEITGDQKITESSHYQEMKAYLLKKLKSNEATDFLNNIYTYNNTFKDTLSKYVKAKKQMPASEEEDREISNLEREIFQQLARYKNYRGLCICRQKNDDNYYKPRINAHSQVLDPNNKYKLNYNSNYTFKTIEEKTDDYNKENDEFLSKEEYSKMMGEDIEDTGYLKKH